MSSAPGTDPRLPQSRWLQQRLRRSLSEPCADRIVTLGFSALGLRNLAVVVELLSHVARLVQPRAVLRRCP